MGGCYNQRPFRTPQPNPVIFTLGINHHSAPLAIRERVAHMHLRDKSQVFNTDRVEALEVQNLIEVAQATIVSAAARKECRGAHMVNDYEYPADHPTMGLGRNDQEWMKHTLWHSATNSLSYKPVTTKPLTVATVPPQVRTF